MNCYHIGQILFEDLTMMVKRRVRGSTFYFPKQLEWYNVYFIFLNKIRNLVNKGQNLYEQNN